MDIGINAFKIVIHKAANATGDFLGNKIVDEVAKSYYDKVMKTKPVQKIIIPTDEKE